MNFLYSLLALFLFCVPGFDAQTKIRNVDADAFNKLMISDSAVVVDLRTPAEIAAKGKIKGALEIDYLSKDAEKQISALDKNKTYLVYCAGGGRSSDCAEFMEKKGFRDIVNLEKGFSEWLMKGYQIEKK